MSIFEEASKPLNMQYDVNTPAEYLKQLPNDWRKSQLEALRQLIQTTAPELDEAIEYKMLRYGRGDKSLFHLNAQKNYVSLYVGNLDKISGARQLLSGLSLGKGCIRITKTMDVAHSGLPTFIQQAVSLWQQGKDTDC